MHLNEDRVQWQTVINTIIGSIKGTEFLNQLGDSQLLKKVSWRYLLFHFPYMMSNIGAFWQDLLEEASKYPLHGMLHDSSTYVFACINSMAEREDLLDESRHLSDVRPFCAVLRLIERKGDKAENTLNIQISHLIGKGMYVHKLHKL